MNFDLNGLLGMLPQIKETIGKAKEYLPKVVEFENATLTAEEKQRNCKIVYSAMLTGSKVFIYVWVVEMKGDDLVISREVKRLDLLPLLENPENILLNMLG